VLGPLARIRQVAGAWSQRDFARRISPSGAEEIQTLSEDLNSMASLLASYEQRRGEEIEQARQIQANLMPTSLPAISGLALTTAYRPAEVVAGDLYDVFPLSDDATAVAILDVSGHGLSAAMLTGIVKMALHHHLQVETSPKAAMAAVNADLLACVVSGQFVTLCLGIWDRRRRTWTYVSAGHPGGVLQSQDKVELLGATGQLLGVLDGPAWHTRVLSLRQGDRIFLYTDGVIEAGKPAAGMEEEGLRLLLESLRGLEMREQVRRVMDEVNRLSGPRPQDDSTIVALEVLNASGPEPWASPKT
jgi:serine phosphatase RsbU (regulator of sigma subunit)